MRPGRRRTWGSGVAPSSYTLAVIVMVADFHDHRTVDAIRMPARGFDDSAFSKRGATPICNVRPDQHNVPVFTGRTDLAYRIHSAHTIQSAKVRFANMCNARYRMIHS